MAWAGVEMTEEVTEINPRSMSPEREPSRKRQRDTRDNAGPAPPAPVVAPFQGGGAEGDAGGYADWYFTLQP